MRTRVPAQRSLRLLLCPTLLALALPGCALLKGLFEDVFQKPSLQFKSAKLREASLAGMTVDLVYTLKNPNDFALSLADIDYTFFLEGKQLVAGKPREGLNIRANDSSELTFPATVKFADIVPAVGTLLSQDTASYRAEGNVGVKTPVGVLSFPLHKEGEIELPKVPAVSLSSPKVTGLSLSGATLELPLVLENKNSFPLPLAAVRGQLSIAGSRVGDVSSKDLGLLAAGETRTVTLPVTVSFGSALSAANAIRSGRGNVAIRGELVSGGEAAPFQVSDVLNFLK